MKISRVLIVLNSTQNLESNLEKAFNIAKTLEANVELLYVHEEPIFDIRELFEDSEFNADKVKELLKSEVAKYSDKEIAIFVKISDTPSQVWELLRDDKTALIVTPYSPLCEDIEESNESPLYVIKHNKNVQKAVLYFESLDNIKESLEFLKNFSSDISLIYNFFYIAYSDPIDSALGAFSVDNEVLLETQEELFNELKEELKLDAKMFINSVSEGLSVAEYINQNGYDLTTLCNVEDGLGFSSFEDLLEDVATDLLKI